MWIFYTKFDIIPFKFEPIYILKLLTKHEEPYWLALACSKYANPCCFDVQGRLKRVPFETSERVASFQAACCEEPLAALWLGEG